MIKTKDFKKRCNCRSVGECNHNITAEFEALDAMVDKFAEEMKRKLHQKVLSGKRGWDEIECMAGIREDLICHANQPGQEIDTANLAAMLWNMSI